MPVQFVLGPPGSGKTYYCLAEIKKRLGGENPLYFLVPEQYSLQAERLLLKLDPASPALFHTQALSFNRLAHQLLSKLGVPEGKRVDEIGRSMILRKCLLECGDRLVYYKGMAGKQGFIKNLAACLTEFNRYGVTGDKLNEYIEKAPARLKIKLADLALIQSVYQEAAKGKYLMVGDMLDALCERLETGNVLQGRYFYVDGFSGFTPQERQVLAHIIRQSAQIVITLPTMAGGNNSDINQITAKTLEKLKEITKSHGALLQADISLESNYRHRADTGLYHFVKNYSPVRADVKAQGQGLAGDIEITRASDRYNECHEAARRIRGLVKNDGYRFHDIGILCGDGASYNEILANIFKKMQIPLFVDIKTEARAHPLTELIRSAMDVVVTNWSYDSVFRFLKTRLTDFTLAEIDIMENYVLKHGVKSWRWARPFERGPEDERLALLNIFHGFMGAYKADKKESVKSHAIKIYDMLYALNIPDKLSAWHDERLLEGDHETARLHKQIWPKINEIVDRLVEIMGGELISLKEFSNILEAGLEEADLGFIPPFVDQVFLGDIGRSRFPEIKALFVIGANENKLPAFREESGLLSDEERIQMIEAELELSHDASIKAYDDIFSLYLCLCRPSEKLIFSYAEASPDGGKIKKAGIINSINLLLPHLIETKAPPAAEYDPAPYAPPIDPLNIKLTPETCSRIYGNEIYTAASRLEQFSMCPFSFFLKYNMRAQERELYQVQPIDLGLVYHNVLAAFTINAMEEKISWGQLGLDEIKARINHLVDASIPEWAALKSTARNRHVMEKIKRICTTSIWAMCHHLNQGKFTPKGVEWEVKSVNARSPDSGFDIKLSDDKKMIITGRVDRIDIMDAGKGENFVKIIDYKSGGKKFDISEVSAGVQLQLALYMGMLVDNDKNALRPGGVFYFHIDDPIIPIDGAYNDKELEAMVLRHFKMSGLALADDRAIIGMDTRLSGKEGESYIIPVSYNKSGGYGKASSVAEYDNFIKLNKMAVDKAKDIGVKLIDGVICPDPYKKGPKTACDFCPYDSVCKQVII